MTQPAPELTTRARPTVRRALLRLLVFVLIVAAVANPLVLLLDATDNQLLESSLENVCVAIGLVAALAVTARWLDRRPLSDYGFERSARWLAELGAGFVIGGAAISAAVGLLFLAGWLDFAATPHTTIAAPVGAALAGQFVRYAAGSVFEELFSRAFLLRMIAEVAHARGMSAQRAIVLAAIVTSVVFGALHLFNPGATALSAVNLALLGLLFALPMIVTGRLSLSIGLHAAWNVLQNNLFGLPNSGKPAQAALLAVTDSGPTLWTGGAFGPEGGLVTLAALVVGAALVLAWLSLRGVPVRAQVRLAE